MRDLLVTVIVFGAVPLILLRPHIGILVYSWLAYMNPHRFTWGFAYDFPFSQLVAVTMLAALLFHREKLRFPWTPLTVVWIAFIAWTNLTTLFAIYPDLALEEWDRLMKIQLISLLTILLMHNRVRLEALLWVIVLSLGFFGLKGGIFAIATGGNYRVWGPPGSFIEDNNALALALVMALPLMRYLQLQYRTRWLRWGLAVLMGLTGLAILATYSRGGFLTLGAMAVFLWLKSRQKLVLGGGLVAAALVLLPFMPEQWFERMGTISGYAEDGSASTRINGFWFAFNLARDHPIVGGGFRTFTPELFWQYAPDPKLYADAHSIYFEVLGEQGFVGLALFLLLGVMALRTGSWIIRSARERADLDWARDLAAMIQVTLVGYAVGGLFLGLAYFDLYYHLLAMLVILRSIVETSSVPVRSAPARRAHPAVTKRSDVILEPNPRKELLDLPATEPKQRPVEARRSNSRVFDEVVAVLGHTLQLGERARLLRADTKLFGSLPELDSMAVVTVITSLEEQFGFLVDDDEISAATFATVGSLVAFVEQKILR